VRRPNPAFIPRNHNMEEALLAATSRDDFSVMERLPAATVMLALPRVATQLWRTPADSIDDRNQRA
jgi:uncharacterized protein YdiU (UPF0061 family)